MFQIFYRHGCDLQSNGAQHFTQMQALQNHARITQGTNAMSEARSTDRLRALMRAQAIFNNGCSVHDCQIRNISKTGAKLILSASFALPDQFDLHIPARQKTYRATLRWRSTDEVGVAFAAFGENDMLARIAELEAETRSLRSRNAELSHELARLSHSIHA